MLHQCVNIIDQPPVGELTQREMSQVRALLLLLKVKLKLKL